MKNTMFNHLKRTLTTLVVSFIPVLIVAQDYSNIRLGLHFDPVISWFGTDIKQVESKGARPGFSFGLIFNNYFSDNYAFSSGINIISAGGKIVSSDTTLMDFTNFDIEVPPGKPVIYKIQYLSIPLGLKLQTNQIGYLTFFTDIGVDPKVVIGGKVDIPSSSIEGEKATLELRALNMSYHITAGIEYSLGGQSSVILGLNFENNFMDVTKETGSQRTDKVTNKLLGFRLGMNF
ncbi:MAG TPA: porin family protein [Bacteroidales bacterium]|nr:porin family protein [Bacteroidales bacterium]